MRGTENINSARNVNFNNTTSGLQATNVEQAIDEIVNTHLQGYRAVHSQVTLTTNEVGIVQLPIPSINEGQTVNGVVVASLYGTAKCEVYANITLIDGRQHVIWYARISNALTSEAIANTSMILRVRYEIVFG